MADEGNVFKSYVQAFTRSNTVTVSVYKSHVQAFTRSSTVTVGLYKSYVQIFGKTSYDAVIYKSHIQIFEASNPTAKLYKTYLQVFTSVLAAVPDILINVYDAVAISEELDERVFTHHYPTLSTATQNRSHIYKLT